MSIRRNPLTGDPVLFAPDRARRPSAFGDESGDRCPFCPGNERDTPPAIAAHGDPWRIRVFPNKFPMTDGAEVIVESPLHDATFDVIEHADDVLRMTIERYAHYDDAKCVAVFKNQGPRSGSSIPHVHSQIVPLPFVPPRIARELEGFAHGCPLCAPEGSLIRETSSFSWIAPAASAFAYQQWIVPKRHVAEMTAFSEAERAELASLLRSASAAMLKIVPSYTWTLMNFRGARTAHFYVDLFPRIAAIAGLELGTGTFVEIVDPAAAARRLGETP